MYLLNINGKEEIAPLDKPLLSFLRDDLRITSVKDGCSEGACGTCTVLVEGKVVKACVQKVSKFIGKRILTVEGLSQREREVYEYCFGEAGAVQCGFCIPGMVLCAKALLDTNPSPTITEVKKAIKGNLCRCTGYKKIEEAILKAAEYFKEQQEIPVCPNHLYINQKFIRLDAAEKVNGSGIYVDDIVLPGMIYAKAVRSRYPRAIVNKINIQKAKEHPDCVEILLAKDVPYNRVGHLKPDWDVMIPEGGTTRYIGDALALVATYHKDKLDEVCDLVEIDYTELEPITCPTDALKADAPLIHEDGNVMSRATLQRGNAEEAIKNSRYVVTRKYKTPFQEHAFLEPECAIAQPEGDDGILLFSGSQSVYDEQREISQMLRIPMEKVHCQTKLVGGGFGGKEDLTVQHHAALMAWYTKKPVKVRFSRQESFAYHTKRHPMEIELTTACDEQGYLTGMKGVIIADTGAYASLGGPVLHRACTHAAGPYNFQNIDIFGMSVYTNNMVAGAFRGFGVTQSCFAMENNINLLAEMVGISPWDFRYKNAIRPGQILPNGQLADESVAMAECLEAVKEVYEANPYAGIAIGFKNSGTGMGKKDIGRCILSIEKGKVHIRTSAACMGQGIATMCATVLCETTGLDPKLVIHERADTLRTPNSGTSTASRQTVITGEAVRRAAVQLKAELLKGKELSKLDQGRELSELEQGKALSELEQGKALSELNQGKELSELDQGKELSKLDQGKALSELNQGKVLSELNQGKELSELNQGKESSEFNLGNVLSELEGREFYGEYSATTDPLGALKENPISHISYSYGAQVVILNEQGKVTKVVAAYDVGTPVNLQSVEGQIEGGILMGLGYTLTEDYVVEGGYPQSKFGTLGLIRATEAPELEVILVQGKGKIPETYGAKGCGELCLIPTAPACSHAYYRWDGKFRSQLPLKDTFYKK